MKRFKLIGSISALILSIACLAFGVYSATQASFAMSGNVSFSATGIYVKVVGTVKQGSRQNSAVLTEDTTKKLQIQNFNSANLGEKSGVFSGTIGSNTYSDGWNIGHLALREVDESNNAQDCIEIEIKVYNYSSVELHTEITNPIADDSDASDGITWMVTNGLESDISAYSGSGEPTPKSYKLRVEVSNYAKGGELDFETNSMGFTFTAVKPYKYTMSGNDFIWNGFEVWTLDENNKVDKSLMFTEDETLKIHYNPGDRFVIIKQDGINDGNFKGKKFKPCDFDNSYLFLGWANEEDESIYATVWPMEVSSSGTDTILKYAIVNRYDPLRSHEGVGFTDDEKYNYRDRKEAYEIFPDTNFTYKYNGE